jgi:hypothetical protein
MVLKERMLARFLRRGIGVRAVNIRVYRSLLNEFSEPFGEEFVAEIVGQYYSRTQAGNADSIAVKGVLRPVIRERFLTAYDSESELIREGDYFELNGVKYDIVRIIAEKGIYFDFGISRR